MCPVSPAGFAAPIRWPSEAVWQAVEPALPGFTVEVLPEIDSSNTELMRRFRSARPQPEPVLLVAEQQSAGRGRQGRQWQSRRGDSLTFSLGLLMRPANWSGLSLAVGISLAESLDAGSHAIGLKWPNDLWLYSGGVSAGPNSHRKLGGILIETAHQHELRYVVIGVGINIRPQAWPAVDSEQEPAPTNLPGCLQDIDPQADVAATLLRVVPSLVQNLQAFERFGFAPFQTRFARRDVLAGRPVAVLGAQGATDGTAHGVSENGALLVHTATGMKEITSSEVSIRPLPDPSGPGHQLATAPLPRGGPC